MTYEIKKIITLTKEEQIMIKDLVDMFNCDEGLSFEGVWDILLSITDNNYYSELAQQYNYEIRIKD